LIAAEVPTAKWVAALGVSHLSHLRAHIRQQHRAVRTGNKIAQLQNLDAIQTTFHSPSPIRFFTIASRLLPVALIFRY
jgi:hypothetical protein